jgi:Zn-dependent M16 (insulinase) family peptidase
MRYAEAGISPAGRMAEETGGLTQVKLTSKLASQESLSDVIEKLKAIQSFTIANSNQLRVALNCGPESATPNQEALRSFLSALPKSVNVPATTEQAQYPRNAKSFFPLPYQVYYSARAVPTVPYTDPSSAPLEILAKLLTFKQLHPEIREKGGAYGGGAYARGLGGLFGMYSYRDPNPQNSMKIMSEAGQWARERAWTAQDLEEAKLSAFQGYDAPQSVSREGMRLFLSGVTDDMLQERRERLLDVTAEQVKTVADEFLVKRAAEASVAILGEKKDWVTEANGWEFRDLGMAAEKFDDAAQMQDEGLAAAAP